MNQKSQTFCALNAAGKTVYAVQLTKEDRGLPYFCIECGQSKYYTHGDVMRPHFRNHNKSTCNCTEESNLHKAIKLEIESHFGADCISLEYSKPEIGRRADVYLHDLVDVVFEIQISPITMEEYRTRTLDWQSAGCEVVWIQAVPTFSQCIEKSIIFSEDNIKYFTINLDKYEDFFTTINEIKEVIQPETVPEHSISHIKISHELRDESRDESEERLLQNDRFISNCFKSGSNPRRMIEILRGNQSKKITEHYERISGGII